MPRPRDPHHASRTRPRPTTTLGVGQVHLETTPETAVAVHREDLYRLSDPRLSELGMEDLLDTLLIRVREILQVDTVAVLLKDPDADELVARAAKGLEAEVEQRVRIPIGTGFAGRVAAERQAIFLPEVRDADVVNPILGDMGIRSMLGVPLIVEGELIGVLHVGTLTPRAFTEKDAALLALAAARVAPAIERARLFDELGRQRVLAEALQRGLLPQGVTKLPDVDVAVRYIPAKDEVGGDWYEVMPLPGGAVGIAIGDVVGHGVRAATLMAQLRAVLRSAALGSPSPAAVLETLDRYVQHAHPGGMATVLYAVLDPVAGTLTYTRAGHPPAALTSPDYGARLLLGASSPPVGAVRYPRFSEETVPLARGEGVVLYTDGLIERRGESLDVGLDRLIATVAGETDPDVLCAQAVRRLVGTFASEDDVAVVAFRRPPLPPDLEIRAEATRESLAPTRRRLRAWLSERGVEGDDQTDIVLAAGEALANAVEHAFAGPAGCYEVHASRTGDRVTLTIVDDGEWRAPQHDGTRGRGLPIMRSTMDELVVDHEATGTRLTMIRVVPRAA